MKIKLSQTGRRLSVLVGILTTMIVSGCESEDTAQQGPHTKTTADYEVTIFFENGCPMEVKLTSGSPCEPAADGKLAAEVKPPADLVCAKRGQAIQWVSKPADTLFPFEIYFDPFVGRPYKSHPPDHKTRAFIIDENSKAGKYEYSVYGNDCKDGNPVLDPPIRVED